MTMSSSWSVNTSTAVEGRCGGFPYNGTDKDAWTPTVGTQSAPEYEMMLLNPKQGKDGTLTDVSTAQRERYCVNDITNDEPPKGYPALKQQTFSLLRWILEGATKTAFRDYQQFMYHHELYLNYALVGTSEFI